MARLSEIIERCREAILETWGVDAQRAASARGLAGPAFRNILPEYLDALREGSPQIGCFAGRRRQLIEHHFATRIRQGYVLPEIVEELAILGRAIARVWQASDPAVPPDHAELTALLSELQVAASVLTDMFTRHMLEEEQLEKRYGRLLDQVAQHALEGNGGHFEERLHEALALCMEGMEADGGALMLFDAESGRLETTVTLGLGAEALAEAATSLDVPGALATRAAQTEETTFVLDLTSEHAQVNGGLQRSGLRSLLGVRLKPKFRVLGVMYVGSATARTFSPREVQRFLYLGEQLALQLDNVKLYIELRDRIAALSAERELRERFVALVAHDLRAPLGSLTLRADRLMEAVDAPSHRATLERMLRTLRRMDAMIADLLDVHRFHAGHTLGVSLAPCDLGQIAKDVAEELIEVHGPRFLIEADPSLVLSCDGGQIRRALWNLATNAVKYGAPGGVIALSVRRHGTHALLSVHNEGPPIPAQQTATLFEPFARGSSGPRGWGLGLTLVRGCAEAHGGEVRVESSREHGTTFTMELPVRRAPVPNRPNVHA